jgi:hypothetical protein
VLPGCGRFCIVDAKIVDAADIGNNFFVSRAHIGQPRAKAVQELLCEMNPDDVVGSHVVADPAHVIATNPAFFADFTVVIASQLTESSVLLLESILAPRGTPLVVRRPRCSAVPCCAVLCCAVLCCAVLCCAVLCCAVLCCAVLCCAVCCVVLCCVVLCCVVWRLACNVRLSYIRFSDVSVVIPSVATAVLRCAAL